MPKPDPRQLQFPTDQYVAVNRGNVIHKQINVYRDGPGRPKKPLAQSKGDPKSFRFKPDIEEGITRAARSERVSLNELVERTMPVSIHYSLDDIENLLVEHRDAIAKLRNYPELLKILYQLP